MSTQKGYFDTAIIIIMLLFAITVFQLLPNLAHGQKQQQLFPFLPPANTAEDQINNDRQNESTASVSGSNSTPNGTNNAVILDFYDNDIGQFTYAKPILDKYGFKGTFFIVCNWASSHNPERMTWQEINQLYREGHDIESHTMTHKLLDGLSARALDYEVGQSKQCIHDHLGIYPTIFSPPHDRGWDNATVINTIAKYYGLSIGGFVNDIMFLHCYGWKQKQQQQYLNQRDCRPYSDNGTLNYASRYDIKENAGAQGHSNDTMIFDRFANLVNREEMLNSNDTAKPINSVLILGYHNINNTQTTQRDAMDAALFDKEMKYLHDNGIRVITMSDLGYDQNSKYLYVRNNK
jgi:peptidoglycan/xylan/chitin deacetylase (PgdA/CDA1 family)